MATSRSDSEQVAFLMDQANHEDSVLQGYRSTILTVHSVILAGGAILAGAMFQMYGKSQAIGLAIAMILVSLGSLALLRQARTMLEVKEREVTYFHRRVIMAEAALPETERHFTRYKVFQRKNKDAESAEGFDASTSPAMPQAMADRLPFKHTLEVRPDHSPHDRLGSSKRAMLMQQFSALKYLWWSLIIASIAALVWRG